MKNRVLVAEIPTPVGEMIVGATDEGICLFDFVGREMGDRIRRRIETRLEAEVIVGDSEYIGVLRSQVDEYFEGSRTSFDLPVVMTGTAFEEDVWRELLNIPYGEVRSYTEQAEALGKPGAVRAVARANGANCLAIIVPCHRVVGANGALTGYAGGLSVKKTLLDLEARHTVGVAQMGLFN